MTNRFFTNIGLLASGALLIISCNNEPKNKNHGPILLGDSSGIVTETDPVYLQDMVQDLRPMVEASSEEQPIGETVADKDVEVAATEKQVEQPVEKPVEKPAPPKGNGLNIAFREVSIFIPNIATRSYGRQDLQNARGATFELSSGNLSGNQLQITSGKVQKVTQRYQTVIAIQDGGDKLALESLGTYASSWQALKGNGSSFNIAGLEPARLENNNPRPQAIKNAVQQATRKARMSRKEAKGWEDAARNVRSADKSPCVVLLRSVSWRIEGKDAAGKSFNKEVRIDMPR